ncbi:MAG: hypothetical protein LUC97_02190 [Clostridiales bacterium]|nr:hypothetical protein [Clostridiales bacterium]
MKKEYTKPNMEIVSFNLEDNITDTTSTIATKNASAGIQNSFKTINY